MRDALSAAELQTFADWLWHKKGIHEQAPYLKYLDEENKRIYYEVCDPFELEWNIRNLLGDIPLNRTILITAVEGMWFAAAASVVVSPLPEGNCYQINQVQVELPEKSLHYFPGYEVSRSLASLDEYGQQQLFYGIALLTAEVYHRATDSYPGTVLFTMNNWPSAIRVH